MGLRQQPVPGGLARSIRRKGPLAQVWHRSCTYEPHQYEPSCTHDCGLCFLLDAFDFVGAAWTPRIPLQLVEVTEKPHSVHENATPSWHVQMHTSHI